MMFALVLLSLTFGSVSPEKEITFQLAPRNQEVKTGESSVAILTAKLGEGWHLYSMELPEGGPIATTIAVVEDDSIEPDGPATQPSPIVWFDPNFQMETNYFKDRVEFKVPYRVRETAPKGPARLQVEIRYMLCSETVCLPPRTKTLETRVDVKR